MPGRRQFAKKSEGVRHFRLVSRSQHDSNADDPDATPLVLEPFVPVGMQRKTGLSEAELMSIPPSLERLGPAIFGREGEPRPHPATGSRATGSRDRGDDEFLDDDLDGDCYFPKDGYNYDQHLKRIGGGKSGGVVGVILEATAPVPREVFAYQPANNDEEMEVLRALDEADEYEELSDGGLEDLIPNGAIQQDQLLWGPAAEQYRDMPDLAMFKDHAALLAARGADAFSDDDEDEEYGDEHVAASSSRKAPAASAAEFDRFFANEYNEDGIGAMDDDEIEGEMDLEDVEGILDEYLAGKEAEQEKLLSIYEPQRGRLDDVPRVIEETKAIIERHYMRDDDDDDDATSTGGESEDESRTWDCETVLSTLSNVSNRPGKIGRIKAVKKPAPALKSVKEGSGENEEDEENESEAEEVVELPDVITTRPKGETTEERKLRKASVKEMRRVCRKMKKESKEMYRAEAAKLPGQSGSADIRPKARVMKL